MVENGCLELVRIISYLEKYYCSIAILVTAVFTLLTPLAAKHSLYLLYAVRIIEGLGEGVTFPAMLAEMVSAAREEQVLSQSRNIKLMMI